MMYVRLIFLMAVFFGLYLHCTPVKQAPRREALPPKRAADRPISAQTPMDTIRWRERPGQKPPIGPPKQTARPDLKKNSDSYTIALLLPFLTNQFEETGNTVSDKNRFALQFYAGARLALEELSKESPINLVVDVYDTQASDMDFRELFNNSRFDRADVYIGPIKTSHVGLMAEHAKLNRKIVVSPETPSTELTSQNPDFIQINPSLRAHCAAIMQYVRRYHQTDAVTLVAKQKEADRLPYFQGVNPGAPMQELIVPDEMGNFDKIDLKAYIKPNRTSVFILPSWADQDFIVAFLRRLRAVKGNNPVEVYGMPQWRNFQGLESEFLLSLNVHISSASYLNYEDESLRQFQQAFYLATGTIPDEDGFNGYDVTLFTGRMLQKYGLSFPERLPGEFFNGFRTNFRFSRVNASGPLDSATPQFDYLENTYVYIMKFTSYGFVPAD